MKKTLLAFAVLGAFAGAASAQSNVTVYGVVDAGIQYKNDGNPDGKTVGLESGMQSGSRIGFKGTEDLGGGLSAIFTLENGFTADDGKAAQGSRLFGRQAWVGLNGGFGTVKLGRQESALFLALNKVDPFSTNLAGNAQKVFGYGQYAADPFFRADNTLSYSTANFGGFSAGASYSFGEKAGDNKANRSVAAAAQYANGPVNVQFAYQKSNTASLVDGLIDPAAPTQTTADIQTAFIGGTYDFRVAKAHLGFGDTKFEQAGEPDLKARNWLVGVSAPVGAAGTVLASYVRNDFKDADNATSNQYALGYSHALSKRTNLYTSYSYLKNDSDVALNTYKSAQDGKSVRTFNVGVRHQF
jgi:predicted porin